MQPMSKNERRRIAMQLRHASRWSLERIARHLEMSASGVYRLLSRASAQHPSRHPTLPRRRVRACSLSRAHNV
jgi:AraC-like DNA-binding protein